MISYLQGKVLSKNGQKLTLLTGGVGYSVQVSSANAQKIEAGSELQLFIHSHIREDAFDLYGFSSEAEMSFFKQLISVSGIGPKVGMEICNLPVAQVKSAILGDDIAYITSIPGIGKKTAQRLVLELKNKIEVDADIELGTVSASGLNEDIIDALINLGYQRKHVVKRLKDLPEGLGSEEEIITHFLKSA